MTPVEKIARAIEKASCPHREGPFGGYDYGHPDDRHVEGGRYVIRDFRDMESPDWGKWLHQTDDSAEHERMFEKMTQEHIVLAALSALLTPSEGMVEAGCMTGTLNYKPDVEKCWQAMVQAAMQEGRG